MGEKKQSEGRRERGKGEEGRKKRLDKEKVMGKR